MHAPADRDWIRSASLAEGIEVLAARFGGHAFAPHRHDTYAIGVTEFGVQGFDYRGAARIAMPGEVVILHPDELHDGRACDARGFAYAIVYIRPALIAAAVEAVAGRPRPLPFVADPVIRDPALAATLRAAMRAPATPLLSDALTAALADALLRNEAPIPGRAAARTMHIDAPALTRVRAYLDAECTRALRSDELESVGGLDRFTLARQFRAAYGTSPYRYQLMRRLDRARRSLDAGAETLADIASESGFADQAHMTRSFKATYGVTPGRYRRLQRPIGPAPFRLPDQDGCPTATAE